MGLNDFQKVNVCEVNSSDILVIGGSDETHAIVEKLKSTSKEIKTTWIGNSKNCDIDFFLLEQLLRQSQSMHNFDGREELYDKRREFYFAMSRESQDGIMMHHAEYEFNAHIAVAQFVLKKSGASRVILSNVPHLRWQIVFEAACRIQKVNILALLPTNAADIRGISVLNLCTEYREIGDTSPNLLMHSNLQQKKLQSMIEKRKYYYMEVPSQFRIIIKNTKAFLVNVLPVWTLHLFSLIIWKNIKSFKTLPLISKDFSCGNRNDFSRNLFFRHLKTKLRNLNNLEDNLNILSSDLINLNERFVYFPLHYQPEATTMPMTSRYVDQVSVALSLATGLECLGIKLIVKEHSSTFNIKFRGDRGRFKSFYEALTQHQNIILSGLNVNDQDLLSKSEAVIAMTGTAAVEKAAIGGLGILMGSHYALGSYSTLVRASSLESALNLVKNKIEPLKLNCADGVRLLFNIYDADNLDEVCAILRN